MKPTTSKLGLKSTHWPVRKSLGANHDSTQRAARLRLLMKMSAKSSTLLAKFHRKTKTPPKAGAGNFSLLSRGSCQPRPSVALLFAASKPTLLTGGSLLHRGYSRGREVDEIFQIKPATCYNWPEKVSCVVGGPDYRAP